MHQHVPVGPSKLDSFCWCILSFLAEVVDTSLSSAPVSEDMSIVVACDPTSFENPETIIQ